MQCHRLDWLTDKLNSYVRRVLLFSCIFIICWSQACCPGLIFRRAWFVQHVVGFKSEEWNYRNGRWGTREATIYRSSELLMSRFKFLTGVWLFYTLSGKSQTLQLLEDGDDWCVVLPKRKYSKSRKWCSRRLWIIIVWK